MELSIALKQNHEQAATADGGTDHSVVFGEARLIPAHAKSPFVAPLVS